MRATRAFTLIELMIVIAIIAVVAAIAIPNLLSARLSANESAAIATLRDLISAQSQFQKRAAADDDNDGLGEYGVFAELSGRVGVRGGAVIKPVVFTTSFQGVNAQGEAAASGYQFRIYLPDVAGTGLGEIPGGGVAVGIDADLAENIWCGYAWPTNYQQSGVRTFFINQGGDIVFAVDENYSGPGNGPPAGAAMRNGGVATSITGIVATGTTGRDGNFWKTVGN
jgi:prepilin-type N-terminal cleavage/methylation domain-containing protein